jgi:hypothetical protein
MRVIAAIVVALVAAVCLPPGASTSTGATPTSLLDITAVALAAPEALFPGESVPVQVTVRNDTGQPFALDPRTIVGRVSSLPRGCRASWFTFEVGAREAIVVAGDGATVRATGRLELRDANTDQSACAGAHLMLFLSVR